MTYVVSSLPGRRSDQWNARREGGSRTLLSSQIVKRYEAALERLNDRLRPILDAKLSQQVGDVGLHGFVADIEGCGDLAIRMSQRKLAKDVALARCEVVGGRTGVQQLAE